MDSEDELTVWCGNLPGDIDEELLYELFLQVAPLKKVRLMIDAKTGKQANYAFITFKHKASVQYAIQSLHGTRIFDRAIVVRSRSTPQNALPTPHPQMPCVTYSKNNRNARNYPGKPGGRNVFRDEKRNNNYHRNNNYSHNRYEQNEDYGRSKRRH